MKNWWYQYQRIEPSSFSIDLSELEKCTFSTGRVTKAVTIPIKRRSSKEIRNAPDQEDTAMEESSRRRHGRHSSSSPSPPPSTPPPPFILALKPSTFARSIYYAPFLFLIPPQPLPAVRFSLYNNLTGTGAPILSGNCVRARVCAGLLWKVGKNGVNESKKRERD